MQYKEIDDLYRSRRTPWLPILLGIAAVLVGGFFVLRTGTEKAASNGSETAPAATPGVADLAQAPEAPVPPGSPVPTTPDPHREPYPPALLNAALAEIRQLEAQDKPLETRDKLLALVEDPRSLGAMQSNVESRLAAINLLLVASPRLMPGKVNYIIQRGDSLSKIASKFNCPADLIQKANNLASASVIRPGDTLRVLDHPVFALQVSKRENTLTVTLGGRFFKRYSVGTGTFGKTPVGTFIIRDKIVQPPWWRSDGKVIPFGDPENILGTRWMALQASGETPKVGGYGIHGTWDETSIGKQSSAGCIRMRNADVEELTMLVPRGTPVLIRE